MTAEPVSLPTSVRDANPEVIPGSARPVLDLYGRVHEVAATTDSEDAWVIAQAVLESMSEAERVDALVALLPDYVRRMLGLRARTPTFGPLPPMNPTLSGQPKKELAAAYIATVASNLENKVNIAPAGATPRWKLLKECTAKDLVAAATTRRALAEDALRTARWYEELADFMLDAQAATVADFVVSQR